MGYRIKISAAPKAKLTSVKIASELRLSHRASDGIRTRVNGFAGRFLATQTHPRQLVTVPGAPVHADSFNRNDR